MQSKHLLLAATLAGSAVGQVNPYVFYPQDPERQTVTCTSFVGRPAGNVGSEALMELDVRHVRGVGDANGVIRIFGVYHWCADERLSTAETYDIVIRDGAPGGGPDLGAAAEFLRIAGLTTPPSTNNQRGTWILSDGFGIAGGQLILPQTAELAPNHYYIGVDLPANPLWPQSDGHSLFCADLLNAGFGSTVGENHRAGAPNPTWGGGHGLAAFSTPWSAIVGPLVTSPNLHIGGIDPGSSRLGAPGASLGMNGLFPDISGSPRSDGLIARVTDNLAPFGFVGLGISVGFQPPVYLLQFGPALIGYSHIGDPFSAANAPIVLGFANLQNGQREFSLALPGSISPALVGTDVVLQAIVHDPNINLGEWTNAQAVHL